MNERLFVESILRSFWLPGFILWDLSEFSADALQYKKSDSSLREESNK